MAKYLSTYFLLILMIFSSVSCNSTKQSEKNKTAEIVSVYFSQTAGRGGELTITATKDSLISTNWGIAFKEFPALKKKMTAKDWSEIVSGIQLNLLPETKSGKSRGQYDGPDERFEITTLKDTFNILNASESGNYKQLENLRINLKSLVKQ